MEPNILDSIPDINKLKSFTDRYFSKRYVLNVQGVKNNDVMLMFHTNRITLLSLAPSHFFFQKTGNFKVNFSSGKVDRLDNAVKGKGKKGGQSLNPHSIICKVEFDDESSCDVPCGMKGTLIEVNEALQKSPELLRERPDSDGFIAIILSSIANSEATKNELLTQEEYDKIVNCN